MDEKPLTMEELEVMVKDYWYKTGKNPTHLVVSNHQHKLLSMNFKAKERIASPNRGGVDLGIVAFHLTREIILDIVVLHEPGGGANHKSLVSNLPAVMALEGFFNE